MLTSLRIKNLALVDELRWEPGPGFNSLTGETGAGKSILLDALMLLAGERADKSLIRSGEESCAVEAEVELKGPLLARAAAVIEEIGAEPCEGGLLLLKRTLTAAGTNRQFVNGSPVPLQSLKRLGDLLVDVHGPHDHQSLLRTEEQLRVLDAYGKTLAARDEVGRLYDAWKEIAARRAALTLDAREREEKLERLRHRSHEISAAKLRPGEDEQVERDFRLAHNSRQILEWAEVVREQVAEGEASVLAALAQVEKLLSSWQKIDPQAASWAEMNHAAVSQLQDLAASVRDYAERVDLDAAQLRQLEERMSLLHGLKKKYGPSLGDVIAAGEKAEEELRGLESSDETLAALAEQEEKARHAFLDAARKLAAARRKTAKPLGESIAAQLRGLGFKAADFAIELRERAEPGRTGADEIEFIFAPNVGEAAQPLRAIASSGEMARVMLAVKTTLAGVDEVPILVFDEVDANVGGETAWEVGRQLGRLGQSHQVLCVTHQPQVASQGDPHFHVAKQTREGRTTTGLQRLDRPARLKELSRMLGGESKESLALAGRMIDGKK